MTNVVAFSFLLLLAAVFMLSAPGCDTREPAAEKLYREAMEKVDAGDHAAAVEILDRIIRQYPTTRAAEKARKDVVIYRGIAGAKSRYPIEVARDLMIKTGRALETHRMRRGRFPQRLEEIMDKVPIDPWGNPLEYAATRGGRSYALRSYGGDGMPGGEGENGDLMIRDGRFVTPQGK